MALHEILSSAEEEAIVSLECCGVNSTLTAIPPCILMPTTRQKGATPQDGCCCVQLQIQLVDNCGSICGCDVAFDDSSFNPYCNFCGGSPGWTFNPDVPNDGIYHLAFTGTDCTNALTFGGPVLFFDFCGMNSDGVVGYTVTAYSCTTDPESGNCVEGPARCQPHFFSTISCDFAGASNATQPSLTVDDGYPNPATSSILFNFSSALGGQMSMMLVDLLGNTVSKSSKMISQGDGNINISLGNMQPGAYFCVFDINGEKLTRRVEIK